MKKANEKKPYRTPEIQSYSAKEVLADLGPAVALYGDIPD